MASDLEVCKSCHTVAVAARHGHLQELQTLIQDDHPVDVADNRGWRPIHDAAFTDNVDCLRYLLEEGHSDVNWQCFEGRSALLLGAQQGLLECVCLLLDHGANPNLSDNMDTYPILAAVRSGNAGIVRTLLENGAQPSARLYSGTTPLHLAASEGKLDIVEILVEGGASLSSKEEFDITPVFSAAQHGQADCLKTMLDKATLVGSLAVVNQPAEDGATPLFLASQEGHERCVRLLLAHGASANLATHDPVALPLHAALQFNHVECARQLMAHTSKSRLSTCSAGVFYFATAHLDTLCTQLLVDSGLDVNARGLMEEGDEYIPKVLRYFQSNVRYSKRVSPLTAVPLYRRPIESAKLLLGVGAYVNPRTPYEVPPLLPALDNFRLELAELLIAHGASVNLYHPKVISNMSIIVCLHFWQGLNLLLRCGAEASSLFLREAPANRANTLHQQTTASLQEDALSDQECPDEDNVLGLTRFPIPFWRNLAEARYLMGRTGVSVGAVLLRLLYFVGSVRWDPNLHNYIDSVKEANTLRKLTEQPRSLMHLSRLAVRRNLSPQQLLNDACIQTLPLPLPILEYLLYRDLAY